MKTTQRNIALCIVFSIITCGIYGIYWFIVMTDDANSIAASSDDVTASGGMAFLLTIVTCGIYRLYWAYKMGEKLDNAKTERGMNSNSGNILYLLLCIFGLDIIAYALMQNDLNQLS